MRESILILIVAWSFTLKSKADTVSLELMQGFATHFKESKNYNDSVFKDNLTSTVSLLRIKYKAFSAITLSDSQGDLSFAAIGSYGLLTRPKYSIKGLVGTYILRNDESSVLSGEYGRALPKIKVGPRTWSLTPLVGIETYYHLNKRIDLVGIVTPAFILWGIKYKF